MNLKSIIRSENILSIYLFAFLIPLNPKWYGFAILLLGLELLVKYRNFSKIELMDKLRWNNPMIYTVGFFIAHLIGMLYTTNTSFGWMDVGMKASFIILPILLMVFPARFSWETFFSVFILGVLFSVLINSYITYSSYLDHGKWWMLKDKYLSNFIHRSYWSAYINIGLVFIFHKFLKGNNIQKIALLFLMMMFITMVLLLGSKIMILATGLILLFLFIRFILVSRKTMLGLLVLIMGLSVGVFVIWKNPNLTERFTKMFETVKGNNEYDRTKLDSNHSRVIMWSTSLELISENPFLGVGTGDIKDALRERNYEKGNVGVADANFNAHNQFLNTQLALGILGSFFLFGMLISPFFQASFRDSFYVSKALIILLFFISMTVESYLEIQAGIIPFAFFVSLFGLKEK